MGQAAHNNQLSPKGNVYGFFLKVNQNMQVLPLI